MYFTLLSTSRPLNWLARASSLYSFLFNFCLNNSDAFSFFPRPHTKTFPSWAVLLSHGIHMAVMQDLQRITPVQPPQPSVLSLLVLQHWYTHFSFSAMSCCHQDEPAAMLKAAAQPLWRHCRPCTRCLWYGAEKSISELALRQLWKWFS